MCFARQRRALFRHLNFQKWSENGVFCIFWLRNVLRAATAFTFSTSQLPKVVREWCALHILTSKCASRHNGGHFFNISTSKSGPNPWFLTSKCASCHNGVHVSSLIWPAGSAPAALASLLFDPPEPQINGKTQCFATFLPFRASAPSFFWLFLFSDLLSSNLSLLSASALLCFSSVHIVGSLTSKLPSILLYYTILYHIILYYIILYYTILYYIILHYIILYYLVLYYIVLYYTILYYIILYCIVLYHIIWYYMILYCVYIYVYIYHTLSNYVYVYIYIIYTVYIYTYTFYLVHDNFH